MPATGTRAPRPNRWATRCPHCPCRRCRSGSRCRRCRSGSRRRRCLTEPRPCRPGCPCRRYRQDFPHRRCRARRHRCRPDCPCRRCQAGRRRPRCWMRRHRCRSAANHRASRPRAARRQLQQPGATNTRTSLTQDEGWVAWLGTLPVQRGRPAFWAGARRPGAGPAHQWPDGAPPVPAAAARFDAREATRGSDPPSQWWASDVAVSVPVAVATARMLALAASVLVVIPAREALGMAYTWNRYVCVSSGHGP